MQTKILTSQWLCKWISWHVPNQKDEDFLVDLIFRQYFLLYGI